MNLKEKLHYFTKGELLLWSVSVTLILASFLVFDRVNFLTLAASLIGVTSLIFNAKGNPVGQLLMVIFSVLYGIISFRCAYYGEMATYVGMTGPMSAFALVTWLKNPFRGAVAQVKVGRLKRAEYIFMPILTAAVTVAFYFLLAYFNTAQLLLSTLSVTTSFVAVYLTFRRSAFFAAAYAANDVVLIVLWILAAVNDISYLSVITCFVVFLVNDIYGFLNWQKMRKQQKKVDEAAEIK